MRYLTSHALFVLKYIYASTKASADGFDPYSRVTRSTQPDTTKVSPSQSSAFQQNCISFFMNGTWTLPEVLVLEQERFRPLPSRPLSSQRQDSTNQRDS